MIESNSVKIAKVWSAIFRLKGVAVDFRVLDVYKVKSTFAPLSYIWLYTLSWIGLLGLSLAILRDFDQ